MCKEYSGKEGSGPYGCSVPASFEDMMDENGDKVCLPCANDQREEALAKDADDQSEPEGILQGEEVIDFDKALDDSFFELQFDDTTPPFHDRIPSGSRESSMQEKIDWALRDDESGAVDIFSIFMLLALPIVLLVNMARR